MSMIVYEESEKEIDLTYKEKNKPKIEKETCYILGLMVVIMEQTFKNRLYSISFDPRNLQY